MSDAFDHQLNATSFAGTASGWEGAAALTRKEAGEAFVHNDELLARVLRNLATMFTAREQEARASQKKEEQMEANE